MLAILDVSYTLNVGDYFVCAIFVQYTNIWCVGHKYSWSLLPSTKIQLLP